MTAPARSVRIRVPATSANLGPGFDCLGMAVDLANEFAVEPSAQGGESRIEGRGACAGVAGADNLFFRAYRRACDAIGIAPRALSVVASGEVPQSRGLGSSATAIAAGVVAAWAVEGRAVEMEAALLAATREEGHPDNVAPALLGGLTAAADLGDRVGVVRREPHPEWRLAFFVPDRELSTAEARRAIPKEIPHRDAVFNLARIPLIVEAIATGDAATLARVVKDRLHEPYRRGLIPGFDAVGAAARGAGATAVWLSGAGPTTAAICVGDETARRVAEAMAEAARAAGAPGGIRVLRPSLSGATVA